MTQHLGIDVAAHYRDIIRLVGWKYRHTIKHNGWDFDDVMQDIFKGLLIRNKGTCPFDGKGSGFAHYILMVANGIILNKHRGEQRRSRPSLLKEGDEILDLVDPSYGPDEALIAHDLLAKLLSQAPHLESVLHQRENGLTQRETGISRKRMMLDGRELEALTRELVAS